MQEIAIDNAIVQIHCNAQADIRAWYTRWGVDGTPANFIIRWFLYHLFRNRDARNDRKARSMDFHADDDEDEGKWSFRASCMDALLKLWLWSRFKCRIKFNLSGYPKRVL